MATVPATVLYGTPYKSPISNRKNYVTGKSFED